MFDSYLYKQACADDIRAYKEFIKLVLLKCEEDQDGIRCDMFLVWLHKTCLHLANEESEDVVYANPWFCSYCLSIKSNKITWGEYEGEEAIKKIIESTYNNILGGRRIYLNSLVVKVESLF